MEQAKKVKKYYDKNTPIFIRIGRSKASNNIHRAVWGEGVTDDTQAMTFTNKLILEEINKVNPNGEARVLDLGCGVGAPIFYLAEHNTKKAHYVGVSISEVQIKIANKLKKELDYGHQCEFIEADFHDLPHMLPFDVIYLVEAMIHSHDPKQLISQIVKKLKPGGKLIICDDFLSSGKNLSGDAQIIKILNDYKKGWHVGQLLSKKDVIQLTGKFGLKLLRSKNLTPDLNLWTFRDKMAHFSLLFYRFFPFKSTYMESIKGGDALQLSLLKGIINYNFLIFEKT